MGSHSSLPDQRLDVTKKKTLPPDVPRRLVHLSPCYNHWFLSQHELDLSSFSITIFQQAPWVAAPVSASPSTPWRQLLLVELIEVRAIFSAFRHLRHLLVYLLEDSLLRRREAVEQQGICLATHPLRTHSHGNCRCAENTLLLYSFQDAVFGLSGTASSRGHSSFSHRTAATVALGL